MEIKNYNNIKSRWHEITEEEKNIDNLFKNSDKLLFKVLDDLEKKYNSKDKEFSLDQKSFEKINKIVMDSLKEDVFNTWKIWNKHKIADYFHEIWEEVLFLIKYNIFDKNDLLSKKEWDFDFKEKEYWEIINIIENIYSAFDKFANIYCTVHSPTSLAPDDKYKDWFYKWQKNSSFNNIRRQLNKILNSTISNNLFLDFSEKIISYKYWKEYRLKVRNDFIHGYLSFGRKINNLDLVFIFLDLYILLRSLWFIAIINFDTFGALENIFSKNDPEWSDYELEYKNLLQDIKLVENLKKADQLFSFMLYINAGSHINRENLLLKNKERELL